MRNRRVILTSRPTGIAQAENFAIDGAPIREPEDGEVLIRNAYLSVEPAMRGWIADAGNYAEPVPLGGVMRAIATGRVVRSRDPRYLPGEAVTGWFGWQDYATVVASAILRKVGDDELTLSLGVLGINGMTAYLAFMTIGAPKAGETVVVSTAAGAVGSAVGQIAKIHGCRTVGITGGPEKARQCLEEFGYDAAIDYRNGDVAHAVAAACPQGVDIYFDNTGGPISDAVMPCLANNARVVICGTASISAWSPWPSGPRVERHLLVKRARMQGFVIFDHADRYDEAVAALSGWIAEGRLRYEEDILEGIEACPDALAGLYRGENRGKRLIRLDQS